MSLKDFLKNQQNLQSISKIPVKPREGKSLRDVFSQMPGSTIKSSSTYTKRMDESEEPIANLLSTILLQDNKIKVTLYDGEATEIVEDYEHYQNLSNQLQSETERIKTKLETQKTSIPDKIEAKKHSIMDPLSTEVSRNIKALNDLKKDIEDTIKLKEEAIQSEIDSTLSNSEKAFKETLEEAERSCNEIYDIMNDLGIPQNGRKIQTDDEAPAVEELLDIAKTDASLIKAIQSSGDMAGTIDYIAKIREDKIKAVAAISSSVIFAPVSLSVGMYNVGKKFIDIQTGRKIIQDLRGEIQYCFRMCVKQINEFKTSYCMPDISDLKEQLKNVHMTVEHQYSTTLKQAEDNLNRSKEAQGVKQSELHSLLEAERERLEREYEITKEQDMNMLKKLTEDKDNYAKQWERRKYAFEEKQVFANLNDKHMIDLLSELCVSKFVGRDPNVNPTLIDQYRIYNKLATLKGLEYHTEPVNDSDEEKLMCDFDKSLLADIDRMEKQIIKFKEKGHTKEFLEKRIEEIKRELDHYYIPTFKGIDSGYHIHQRSVEEALNGAKEIYHNKFGNKSMLFVYDKTKAGDENYLANFIKFIVQEVLLLYNADVLKVNIISPGKINRIFNNLQVNLDKINKETKSLEKGRDFSKIYIKSDEIDQLYKELVDQVSRMMKTDLSYMNIDELAQDRRLKGAVTPMYNINVLHNVPLDCPFSDFNLAAGDIGIINIYLVEKQQLMEYKEDKKEWVVLGGAIPFIESIGVIGESVFKGDQKIIYMTDIKNKEITRFQYDERTADEEVKCSKDIRNWALSIPKPVVTTEEFIESLEETKDGYWKCSAEKTLKLFFGYINGDASQPVPTVLDENDSVHMFIGGTTGGGKSNVLAVMVNTLKMIYPPSQLDIIYFDFKKVEVMLHAKPYKMPHCTAMSGTESPEYLISLLDFTDKEMMKRYDLMTKWGAGKLSELRKFMKAEVKRLRLIGEDEEANVLESQMPKRLVMIVDEAAQAFQIDDSDVVEKVKKTFKRIAQLARAAGMHMILVSQDPAKMPEEVMNLLKWRGCTKATVDVSKSILYGNNIAGRSENQFIGFFATTNDTQGDESANKRYVVPLNEIECTKLYSKITYDMSKNDIRRDAVLFSEDEPYSYRTHKLLLQKVYHLASLDDLPLLYNGHTIILGEPCYFTQTGAPHQLDLVNDDMENLVVVSKDSALLASLFEIIKISLEDKVEFWPIYAKSIPKYAPLEYFVDKAKKDGSFDTNFMVFGGKGALTDEQINFLEEQSDEGTMFEQLFEDDVRTKEEYNKNVQAYEEERKTNANAELIDNHYDSCFANIFDEFIDVRRKHGYKKPLYIFIFGLERHNVVSQMLMDWRSFTSTLIKGNPLDVHFIYFGTDLDLVVDKKFARYYIAGRIGDSGAINKNFKNIPSNFCKLVDMTDPSKSALFKPITFE